MNNKALLSRVELEFTQKFQLHFPCGVIPNQELEKWIGCKADFLAKYISKHFSKFPAPERISREEKNIDVIIRVNRSVSPVYPDWVKKVLHKDLELSGPSEYDISEVRKWLNPDQENGVVKGDVIYIHLKDSDMIKDQLGLADLLAIQTKGIAFFRKYFADKTVFGWKSVVRDGGDDIYVPSLFGYGGEVIVYWFCFENDWHSRFLALRFASK